MRVFLSLLVLAGVAHAEPRVILVETRGAPSLPTLRAQVELHAEGRASVEDRAARDADPLTFAETATRLVAAGDATVVVWIARVDHGYLVFAAGPWPNRALLELVRVEDTLAGAELERTVALKVAGLLDALLVEQPRPRAILAIERPVARPRRAPKPWRIEVGAAIAREALSRGADGRGVLAVSRAWRLGAWRLAPVVAGYYQPSGTIEGETGRASIREAGGAVAAELGYPIGRVEVFARPRFAVGVLMASGESTDGRAGEASVVAPYLGLELGARRRLGAGVWLGVVAGGELAAIHHEFLVDDETVIDLGRGRLHVGLTFAIGL